MLSYEKIPIKRAATNVAAAAEDDDHNEKTQIENLSRCLLSLNYLPFIV
jgi:hypothetical protein